MRTKASHLILPLFALFTLGGGPLPLAAADEHCSSALPPGDCTLGQIYDSVYENAFPLDAVASEDVGKAVTNSNVATTTPDTFAGRVHSSHQDFLNLFSFAVNKVEESKDGQALTVRFNPLREGAQLLGLSVTVAKPIVSDLVSKAIPESMRSATVEKLQSSIGDLDDVTYAAAYSLESTTCEWIQPAASRCWGRSPELYRQMLSEVLVSAADKVPDIGSIPPSDPAIQRLRKLVLGSALFDQKLEAVKEENRIEAAALIRQLAEKSIRETQARKAIFEKSGIDKLASLLDNQPQLVATGSYRDPGRYGGPDETGISFELQYGLENLNALRKDCKGATDCVVRQLEVFAKDGVPTDKLVLTASYKERGRYSLKDLGLDAPVPGFTPISLRKSSEFKARFQWGRLIDAKVAGRNVRFDLSGDGIQTRDDGIRTKNRWVATGTLTLPLGDNMSIPVSLNYANEPEFLTSQRKQLGVHLGITYRLPWEKKSATNP
jgi:hypothetical protein